MSHVVLQMNPDKKDVKPEFWAEKDRYETIHCILCHGIHFIRVDADRSRVVFIFDKREIVEVEEKLLTGRPFDVPWYNVIMAQNIWKDALIALKEYRRNAI